MLLVQYLPFEVNSLTKQDVNNYCNELPENRILRDCKSTKLENMSLIIQRMRMNLSRVESSMSMELVQYTIFFKNKA